MYSKVDYHFSYDSMFFLFVFVEWKLYKLSERYTLGLRKVLLYLYVTKKMVLTDDGVFIPT